MALTRKMLKAMEIDDEKIDQIIDAHTDVTDALKADRDKYKADAEKSYNLERELEETKSELDKARKDAEATDKDEYKEKYEAEKKAFADYKSGIESEKEKANKVNAYKELLKKAGVSEKRIDAIVKVTSVDDIELDADGKIKDADDREKSIKEEWADFIVEKHDEGAGTENPPSGVGAGGGKPLSRAAEVAQKHNERLYGVKGDK